MGEPLNQPAFQDVDSQESYKKTALDIYMDQIRQGSDSLLSDDEVALLAKKIRAGRSSEDPSTIGAGETARNQLVTSNLRLVVNIANKVARNRGEVLDMIQAGNVGLINAANTFNPDLGYQFSTYAYRSIRNEILEFMNEFPSEHPIRIPESKYRKVIGQVRKARLEYLAVNGVEPSADDIKGMVELTVEEIKSYLWLCQQMASLDWSDTDGNALWEWAIPEEAIEKPTEESAVDRAFGSHVIEIIDSKLKDERERIAVRRYYGLGCTALSQDNVGKILGVSSQTVGKVLKDVKKRLSMDDEVRELFAAI